MAAGPVGQPALDAGVLVGAVVVDDEVDVEVRGHVGIDVLEEAQELLVAVARPALGQDPAGIRRRAHEALGAEAFAPLADRLAADAEPCGHRRIVQAFGAQEHDPGAAHQARGQAARPGHRR